MESLNELIAVVVGTCHLITFGLEFGIRIPEWIERFREKRFKCNAFGEYGMYNIVYTREHTLVQFVRYRN